VRRTTVQPSFPKLESGNPCGGEPPRDPVPCVAAGKQGTTTRGWCNCVDLQPGSDPTRSAVPRRRLFRAHVTAPSCPNARFGVQSGATEYRATESSLLVQPEDTATNVEPSESAALATTGIRPKWAAHSSPRPPLQSRSAMFGCTTKPLGAAGADAVTEAAPADQNAHSQYRCEAANSYRRNLAHRTNCRSRAGAIARSKAMPRPASPRISRRSQQPQLSPIRSSPLATARRRNQSPALASQCDTNASSGRDRLRASYREAYGGRCSRASRAPLASAKAPRARNLRGIGAAGTAGGAPLVARSNRSFM
jgi:hypothetical protein